MLRKIDIYSRWDASILLLTFIVAILLIIQKLSFISSMWLFDPRWADIAEVLRANIFVYVAIFIWVWILLRGQHNSWLLRAYVIFAGFIFVTLTRMIEATEEVTRQGVDFAITRHFFLAVFGRGGFAEIFIETFFRYGIFSLLMAGLFFKWYSHRRNEQKGDFSYTAMALFCLSIVFSFVMPQTQSLAKSISQNGLVSLIYHSHWPVVDVRQISEFRFSEKQKVNKAWVPKNEYWALAKDMNVAIITLESTSANMLDFYPQSDGIAGVTPFMSKMAQHSLLINETSAVMASTTKSIVSILCGIEPYLKTDTLEVTLGIPVPCLPKTLSAYDSAYFQTATKYYEGRDRLVSHIGMETFFSAESMENQQAMAIGPLGLEDKAMLPVHKNWLETRNSEKPFIAFYLTLAQHYPYLPISENREYKLYTENKLMNDYLNSLNYIDEFVEELVMQYKEQGLYDNTIFVVLGDHGESFAQYRPIMFHNNVMYKEGLWVPFFIFNEKLFPEQVQLHGQYSLIDVAPSIQYLLGVEPSTLMSGESVFEVGSDRAVNAACWYVTRCLSRMDENYKYIFNFGDSPDELYDRRTDHREQNNLVQQYPELVQRYQEELFIWYSDILNAYESYYVEQNPDYKTSPESYYRFPYE